MGLKGCAGSLVASGVGSAIVGRCVFATPEKTVGFARFCAISLSMMPNENRYLVIQKRWAECSPFQNRSVPFDQGQLLNLQAARFKGPARNSATEVPHNLSV
ncbi:MAG: hypothetical protein ABGZ35_15910, partial [Planctomycetaceae bacterium]